MTQILLRDVLTLISAYDKIIIEDTLGHFYFCGPCSDFRATTDEKTKELLLNREVMRVKALINSVIITL